MLERKEKRTENLFLPYRVPTKSLRTKVSPKKQDFSRLEFFSFSSPGRNVKNL